MLIETCVYNKDLEKYLHIAGYTKFLEEGNKSELRRTTIYTNNKSDLLKKIRSIEHKGRFFIFCKTNNAEVLRTCIKLSEVSGIVLDSTNINLFKKKTILNMIREYDKIVDVWLPYSSSFVISKIAIWGYKWINNIVFSSCAKKLNEIWSPLSKINYLVVHGADEELATYWITISPQVLISNASNNY